MTIAENSGKILEIPKKIWFSFESRKNLQNLIEEIHDDKEVIKKNKIKNYYIKS